MVFDLGYILESAGGTFKKKLPRLRTFPKMLVCGSGIFVFVFNVF